MIVVNKRSEQREGGKRMKWSHIFDGGHGIFAIRTENRTENGEVRGERFLRTSGDIVG